MVGGAGEEPRPCRSPPAAPTRSTPPAALPLRLKLGETGARPARARHGRGHGRRREPADGSASASVAGASGGLLPRRQARGRGATSGRPARRCGSASSPCGRRRPGARRPRSTGTIVRREWHSVRRDRGRLWRAGGRVGVRHGRALRPHDGRRAGVLRLHAAGGRHVHRAASARPTPPAAPVSTSFYRWATGKDWVPWNDESQFKMDVIPDRTRYTVGDTATILFASPFTDAEAWITVEREGLLQQRRLTITSGTTTLKLPITEAFAPNVFVSIVVARGRSAPPGPLDDPGRPTIRVGYAELRVTPERKRLTVDVTPLAAEYRPGDTARVALQVRDAAGTGQRSEVTLWAVDEGVLALTGYRTPDPIDLLYQPRGLGHAARQHAHHRWRRRSPKARRAGARRAAAADGTRADILRSRFQTTAFFLGLGGDRRVGQGDGRGEAARQPHDVPRDGRRRHRGRPLRQRPVAAAGHPAAGRAARAAALPARGRPVRGRRRREPARGRHRREVKVAAGAHRSSRRSATQRTRHARGRAAGARCASISSAAPAPTARRFRFDATSGARRRRGRRSRCRSSPRSIRGPTPSRASSHDTASAELLLPADIDPARSDSATQPRHVAARDDPRRGRVAPDLSLLVLRAGGERGASRCVALYRSAGRCSATPRSRATLGTSSTRAVATLSRRQRSDGGIGLWSATDWTTPWLTRLRRRRAARCARRRPRGGRLGARPARRYLKHVARTEPSRSWGRSRAGTPAGQPRLSDRVMAAGLSEPRRPARPRRGERAAPAGRAARVGGSRAAGAGARPRRRPDRRARAARAGVGARCGSKAGRRRCPAASAARLLLRVAHPAGRVPACAPRWRSSRRIRSWGRWSRPSSRRGAACRGCGTRRTTAPRSRRWRSSSGGTGRQRRAAYR